MVFWQNQNRICCLRHRVRTFSDSSHHRSTNKVNRIFYSSSACLGNNIIHSTSKRYFYSYRMIYLSYNRYIFGCYRLFFLYCLVYIIQCLYVKHSNSLLNRKSARSYNSTSCFVDQYNLISHRIHFIQKVDAHSRELFDMLFQSIYCLNIRFFDSNNGLRSSNCFLNHMESFHYFVSVLL